ncbi:MAG: O-antigen ligase family protein [Anaerolineaceae bacterium]
MDLIAALFLGLAGSLSLVAAVTMETKWLVFILFVIICVSAFLILQERERFLIYASVVLTSVFLDFHPIFIESAVFPWPVSGFRINIFEVVFFLLFLSWMIRVMTGRAAEVRFFPWVSIPFVLIWFFTLAGLCRVSMPGIIKFSNMWLLVESWLIFLYFANNIRDRRMVYNIVIALLLTGVIQSFLGLAQYLTGASLGLDIFGESKSYKVMLAGMELVSRVSGTFGHPNNLGGYLGMLLVINLALFWAPVSRRLKWGLVAPFLLISTTLIMTYSRGALIALGVGGTVTLYMCFFRRNKQRALSLMLSTALIVFFFISSTAMLTSLRQRLFEEDYGAARSRIPMSQVAMNIIYNNPWLGVGLGNYIFEAPFYDISREGISYEFPRPVHNEFLLIAAEQGVPSLIMFLFILGYILKRLHRLIRSSDDPILPFIAIGLFATFLGWCVFRQTDYVYVLLGDPFWLLAGLAVAMTKTLETPPDRLNADDNYSGVPGTPPHNSP